MKRKALITGITGQDGSYLAEFLLEKGYQVYGMVRRSSGHNLERIDHIVDQVELISADLLDQGSMTAILRQIQPDEVYNLAAQSFVTASWSQPILTGEATGLGAARLLEAIRVSGVQTRFFQASSSEMFGYTPEVPQRETTYFYPRSPYGVAKLYAHWITINYRESYNMFACCGISFNHESPRRGVEFVTRKITHAAARIKLGLQKKLQLGNLDAKRDWGFAGDYVKGMWLMLQQDKPEEYVLATGETHSVQEFVEAAFAHLKMNWKDYTSVNTDLLRPAEIHVLLGDPSKARKSLGWVPETSFEGLVKLMVDADLKQAQAQQAVLEACL